MKLGCGALLLSSWALSSHLARRSPPLILEHRPTLYVKHGGGFGAATPLDNIYTFGTDADDDDDDGKCDEEPYAEPSMPKPKGPSARYEFLRKRK